MTIQEAWKRIVTKDGDVMLQIELWKYRDGDQTAKVGIYSNEHWVYFNSLEAAVLSLHEPRPVIDGELPIELTEQILQPYEGERKG